MKENEFDIYLKSVLEDAQESVSPSVWDGVQKGLDRKRRARIIPFYIFGTAAAAAAVTLGVFLFNRTPATSVENVAATAVAESVETPAASAQGDVEILPLEEQIASSSSARIAQASTHSVKTLAPAAEPEPAEEFTSGVVIVSFPEEAPSVDNSGTIGDEAMVTPGDETVRHDYSGDARALDLLAGEEARRQSRTPRLSLGVSGNIQNNNRHEIPSSSIHKTPVFSGPTLPAPPLEMGISNEQPEVYFSVPVSAGLSIRAGILPRLSVGTGVQFTGMSRTFVADFKDADHGEIRGIDIDNRQAWLGVPLNLYFDISSTSRWQVYAHAGATAEKLLYNNFLVHHAPDDIVYKEDAGNLFQFSAGAGVGVMFRITKHVGLFMDPSLRYYFNSENMPRSIRTIQPLRFDMEAGVRFFFNEN